MARFTTIQVATIIGLTIGIVRSPAFAAPFSLGQSVQPPRNIHSSEESDGRSQAVTTNAPALDDKNRWSSGLGDAGGSHDLELYFVNHGPRDDSHDGIRLTSVHSFDPPVDLHAQLGRRDTTEEHAWQNQARLLNTAIPNLQSLLSTHDHDAFQKAVHQLFQDLRDLVTGTQSHGRNFPQNHIMQEVVQEVIQPLRQLDLLLQHILANPSIHWTSTHLDQSQLGMIQTSIETFTRLAAQCDQQAHGLGNAPDWWFENYNYAPM
ncbi:hypothetical protein C8R42DRAFT_723837 [Lentinula raphanica]|nr:hypothetical protein C8R42DRAFT_723837 [Lentinula raphanica]